MAAPLAKMSLTFGKTDGGDTAVHLPASLGRALKAAGYTFVDVHVTSAGVLLVPTKDAKKEVLPPVLDLPDWS